MVESNYIIIYCEVFNYKNVYLSERVYQLIAPTSFTNFIFRLGCACAKIVKEFGGAGFAMEFYGECWMATDQSELENTLIDINQQSSKCIGHDYQTCNSSHNNCMGGAESQFVYGFPSL